MAFLCKLLAVVVCYSLRARLSQRKLSADGIILLESVVFLVVVCLVSKVFCESCLLWRCGIIDC